MKKSKVYVSFETRVITISMSVIACFIIAGLFIYNALTYKDSGNLIKSIKNETKYQVCLNTNNFYNESCLDEDMKYISEITDKINVNFDFESKFNRDVSVEYDYYVIGKVVLYDSNDPNKILYNTEEVLIDRTNLDSGERSVSFSNNILIDYNKYNSFVIDYNNRYGVNSNAILEVSLFLDGELGNKEISTLNIPLNQKTFGITKSVVVDDVFSSESEMDDTDMFLALGGVIFCFIGVLLIIYLTSFISKVVNHGSNYDKVLKYILKKYDKNIVIARGDYTIDEAKGLIKVVSFKELLDARNTLDKPIVYVKVNNVKSEFYVEDDTKIYKYVMKEADLEK